MKPINGVVTGIVTAVGAGKVKLKFPWLHESDGGERESNWARIATAMAGNDRGTFLMPEVGDEVIVAFEKGSFDHPYVIGFLWNGKDKPPKKDPPGKDKPPKQDPPGKDKPPKKDPPKKDPPKEDPPGKDKGKDKGKGNGNGEDEEDGKEKGKGKGKGKDK